MPVVNTIIFQLVLHTCYKYCSDVKNTSQIWNIAIDKTWLTFWVQYQCHQKKEKHKSAVKLLQTMQFLFVKLFSYNSCFKAGIEPPFCKNFYRTYENWTWRMGVSSNSLRHSMVIICWTWAPASMTVPTWSVVTLRGKFASRRTMNRQTLISCFIYRW